ncbi:MAG: serine hydroxymethyltransferase [Tumebacillaceae bacterium]
MKNQQTTGLESLRKPVGATAILPTFAEHAANLLEQDDPQLADLLAREYERQMNTLQMIAASSVEHPSVLAAQGTVLSNLTTEGYPGARYHGGCEMADQIETLAIERAKQAFQAHYANVQPHSGTSANQIVMFTLLRPGDTILGLDLNSGGHLSHGAKVSAIGKYFNCVQYGLTPDGLIDYEQVLALAVEHKPKLIVCGASAYPRVIDFARFRAIADQVGAYLLADISHIAGLVAGKQHPSPIDHAHFTTTSTYKQLLGPRGGLILMGRDYQAIRERNKSLAQAIDHGTFPGFQGTPDLGAIAAKARALQIVASDAFAEYAERVVRNANALSQRLQDRGYQVLTGGTDNHLFLIDLRPVGLTGIVAEKALESCGIIVNKNRIPGDSESALVTSGLRFGTNSLALRGMGEAEMELCAGLVDRLLKAIRMHDKTEYELDAQVLLEVQERVIQLTRDFPLPHYVPTQLPTHL